jgi:hypothetical protein
MAQASLNAARESTLSLSLIVFGYPELFINCHRAIDDDSLAQGAQSQRITPDKREPDIYNDGSMIGLAANTRCARFQGCDR